MIHVLLAEDQAMVRGALSAQQTHQRPRKHSAQGQCA